MMALMPILIFVVWTIIFPAKVFAAVRSGFWYGETRPPETQYDSVPYANMTVKINQQYQDGPGSNLVKDPFQPEVGLYVGNTINRQAFDTQFVLDMSYALNIDPSRIYVIHVTKGTVHFSWESANVIVNFIFLERTNPNDVTLLTAVEELTKSIQNTNSSLYHGTNVTVDIDPDWGLQVVTWDLSLRLTYAIEVVGGPAVQSGYYLNQGSEGTCDLFNGTAVTEQYCEFERFFEDDVSKALNISYYRVQILFVKTASYDSVIVHFRILPQRHDSGEDDVTTAIYNLMSQVSYTYSPLYEGNVTVRVDATWGVTQYNQTLRSREAIFTLQYYEYDQSRLSNPQRLSEINPYDRCKANRRCNWGVVSLNQSSNDAVYYHQLFDNGDLFPVNLFLDFEDWRFGARGFSWDGNIPPTCANNCSSIGKARAKPGIIRGAHFWPFSEASLGPDIPCYRQERNQGLILDRGLQRAQVDQQESLVSDLAGRIQWLTDNIENATMGPVLRSRKDVTRSLRGVRHDYMEWHHNEVGELNELTSSQCAGSMSCFVQFNTSSLELTGVINGTGTIKTTSQGTEVALFSFNSIYLGPETKVILVGQRALALLSKTSMVINTTIEALPGYIGGFQGGGSVARLPDDALSDHPRSILICDLANYCKTNRTDVIGDIQGADIISNNVNGPGSGNVRVNAFIIKSSAPHIPEIQSIKTTATPGQTLSGGFSLSFNGYSTTILPHDASAFLMQSVIQQSLNLANLFQRGVTATGSPVVAGVGNVTVTRSRSDSTEGYVWNVTFNSAIGNINQMTAKSYLGGGGASITMSTVRDGNEIGGFFQLLFQGYVSQPIPAAATSQELRSILLGLPIVTSADVFRTDPTGHCDDGLCQNGPYPSRGLMWTVYVTTNLTQDDVTPTSPSSPLAQTQAPYYRFTPLTGALTGTNAVVNITFGTSISNESPKDLLKVTSPFSIAYGGAGASYGGQGGAGYAGPVVGPTYNDLYLSDLLGGSGGCMRDTNPYDINFALGPVDGLGGHGGGAMEFVAANDVIIGSFGKLIARGGDGIQSPQGGGGGGSGGAILISSGTSIINEGFIDVSGGAGGYGGVTHPDLNGGGGGGGRVALYAESIIDKAIVVLRGGDCGVRKKMVSVPVVQMQLTIFMALAADLDTQRLIYLGEVYLNMTFLSPLLVNTTAIRKLYPNATSSASSASAIHAQMNVTVLLSQTDQSNIAATYSNLLNGNLYTPALIIQILNASSNTNIAEVTMIGTTLNSITNDSYYQYVAGIKNDNCVNSGQAGSLYSSARMTTKMVVYDSPNGAAENTKRALFFSNREETNSTTGSAREAPFSANGPIIPFNPSRPSRVTYYTKTDSVPRESIKFNYGSLFSLITRGDPNLNISNVIGVYFGYQIFHGANFGSAVDEKAFLKRMVTIGEYPILDRWYKIDIRIQWEKQTYMVLIDDKIVTSSQPFQAADVDGIRLSMYRAVDVWFDEIYVGFDNTMEFVCPVSLRTGTGTAAPVQRSWSFEDVHGGNSNGYTEYYQMTRHYNFLNTVGSIPFDGQGQVKVNQDIKGQYADGDYPLTQGLIHAGALVYLTNSLRSKKSPLDASYTTSTPKGLWSGAQDGIGGAGDGRQFWYTEYNYQSSLSPVLNGGVAACSSQDLISWRFEGIVFHYTNLSDQVYGSDGPFYVERPKVLFNSETKNYVMWAVMDNTNRTLAMSAIATSIYEDGPFLFRRSFYPDGNQTRDQVIYKVDSQQAVVARTYYQTVEFVIPEAMMQPVWESAKGRNGLINYRSNYHRAVYDIGYDNYNDIYYQRWRKEDVLYQVLCEDQLTGIQREVASGVYNAEGFICNDPEERKIVIGQGVAPAGYDILTSRFVSPNNSENSWWRPTSIPDVLSQAWSNNYRDGYCGIRKLNDDFNISNPKLEQFVPVARNTCSNIADNPVHQTMQDKLIGKLRIITTRRAKFIAISQLTPDYLDTTGALADFEGELESGNLISMIVEMGQFSFTSGIDIQSTFRPPVRSEYQTAVNYKTRFRQYISNVNDRALYSLACVIDGNCPVNFRDQLTNGQV